MNNMYDWEDDAALDKLDEEERLRERILMIKRLESYRDDQPGLVVTAKHLWAYIGAVLVGALLLYAVAFLRGM
jgi:hypothetical protein